MTEIRAFVGHSFLEKDKDVVRIFTDFFDTLSNYGLDFSWEHAVSAEPKILSEKVLSLISNKNVFIGICTKNERVIPDSSLKNRIFSRFVLCAPEKEFAWKTSDWIIQEIGLATGMKLDLILLTEDGVRRPGGIQGDVEFISFDRSAPEKTFGKIIEMIGALSPQKTSSQVTALDPRSPPAEEEDKSEVAVDDHWATPQPDWNRRNFEFAYFMMVYRNDEEGIANINKVYLETEDAQDDENRISWMAFCEYERLEYGKGGNFAQLEKLADDHPNSSDVLDYLARGFVKYEDYGKAAIKFELAASNATDGNKILHLLGRAVVNYMRAELKQKGSTVLGEMKAKAAKIEDGELSILRTLRELIELTSDNETGLAILERIVELKPSDNDTRFSLAYMHSQNENNNLALRHYE